MYKNRFILVLGLLSMLLAGMAVTQSRSLASSATGQAASDFYQRHPEWTWETNHQDAVIPLTGDSAFPDYFQRHPELNIPVERPIDLTDYFFRHPDKNASPLAVSFGAEQLHREYMLGERYGATTEEYARQQALREILLGERYGQRP